MKKLTLIILFSVYTNMLGLYAQSKITYGVGIKSGINLSRFTGYTTNNDFLYSYVAGLSVEQRFTPRISLSYELGYSRQGNMFYYTKPNPGFFDKERTKYDYFILPISFRYRLKRYPIILSPGFQIGYLVNTKTDFLVKNGYPSNSVTMVNESLLKKTDLGFSIGIGYRFSDHFLAEAKYYQSLNSLIKNYSGIDPITGAFFRTAPVDLYNQVFSLSLTYYPFISKNEPK